MTSHGTVIGENCILSGVTLDGQNIPANTALHGLKLRDGRFVVRMYGVGDNPKEKTLFGKTLPMPLWEAPIYPAKDTIKEAVDATLQAYAGDFPTNGISLRDSFHQADPSAILEWQNRLDDKIKVESLLEAIDSRKPLEEAGSIFNGAITPRAEKMLLYEIAKLDDSDLSQFGRKIRIYYVLFRLTGKEGHASSCFGTIRDAILRDAVAGLSYSQDNRIAEDEVVEHLPVRVNWGGGWSDTPPYCMEHEYIWKFQGVQFLGLFTGN